MAPAWSTQCPAREIQSSRAVPRCPGRVPARHIHLPAAPAFVHAGEVAVPADGTSVASPGLSVEVVVAGVAFSAGGGLTGLAALSPQDPPSLLLLLGWPVLALVGGVLLDQHPGAPLARALTALSLAPVPIVVWALVRTGDVKSADLAAAAAELAALLGCAVAIAVPWSVQPPRPVF